MKHLVDHLDANELVFEGNNETDYQN
jgi:hypothetical protein